MPRNIFLCHVTSFPIAQHLSLHLQKFFQQLRVETSYAGNLFGACPVFFTDNPGDGQFFFNGKQVQCFFSELRMAYCGGRVVKFLVGIIGLSQDVRSELVFHIHVFCKVVQKSGRSAVKPFDCFVIDITSGQNDSLFSYKIITGQGMAGIELFPHFS